ncbi:hypothetical protein [Tumebacillus flagellatus]|uniref:hypothetical protein n=1 Tax=Tumebacillus flagellatus TaxID=1157490 RepID=UPI0013788D57|nr:hypothetical protein [Tumebacillus flagellatus]
MNQDRDGITNVLQADFEAGTDETFTLKRIQAEEESADGSKQRDSKGPERSKTSRS